ncbi:hypothetical protein MOBT1_000086 [Malassezia obtusa]|uniref:C-CAP/cofactor C-like domain-containing protein n=1 Tax=Malassezia obtusa TaxID=76774 RepID=A0AAF0E1H9_9BASI|nr:hypothetical protein MOBT1_000086 [Malassezia obtusa]
MANAAEAAAFFATFPRELQALRAQVSNTNGGRSDDAVAALTDARHKLQAAAPRLPAHDLQTYEHELQSIHRQLASQGQQARKKFQFRRTARAETAAPAAPTPAPRADEPPATTERLLTARDWSDTPGVLTHLDTCFVDLRGTSVPTLHIHRVRNSIVLLGEVHGSVFLEHCSHCVISGTMGQFRAIDVHSTAVLANTSTALTLEACSQIQVGGALAEPGAVPPVQDFQDATAWRHCVAVLRP